jgi:hypothetical protein
VNGRALFDQGKVVTIADDTALAFDAAKRARAIIVRAGLDKAGVAATPVIYE